MNNEPNNKLIEMAREFLAKQPANPCMTAEDDVLLLSSFAQHVLDKQWTRIEDGLPKHVLIQGRLVQVITPYGKTRIVRGEFFPSYTMEYYGDDNCDYDERDGNQYFQSGWYEYCESDPNDYIYPIEGKVVAWCELPQPYVQPEKEGK